MYWQWLIWNIWLTCYCLSHKEWFNYQYRSHLTSQATLTDWVWISLPSNGLWALSRFSHGKAVEKCRTSKILNRRLLLKQEFIVDRINYNCETSVIFFPNCLQCDLLDALEYTLLTQRWVTSNGIELLVHIRGDQLLTSTAHT